MCNPFELGVRYTEHERSKANTPVASLWSYETCPRGSDRGSVALTRDGNHEYWLDRSDPLLNTILPGTGVSLIVNFGDRWAAGASLVTSAPLPRACVVGPVTQMRHLRVGRSVRAVGAGLLSLLTPAVFGVPASDLVDRIVPLDDLWTRNDVEQLYESLLPLEATRCASALRDELMARIGRWNRPGAVARTAARLIQRSGGRLSVDAVARNLGLSRQQVGRQFHAAAGLPPKLFARVTRFQALVHALLTTDVSTWASLAPAVGFYDQAHMINEFRAFAGSPPTVFFQPHHGTADRASLHLRGRPGEWSRQPELATAHQLPVAER